MRRSASRRLRAILTRLLMMVPVAGVATASPPAEAGIPDGGLAITRVEQIRQQLRVQDRLRVQNGDMASSSRRQFAQWYNFPNWPNWSNWANWRARQY